MSRLHADPVANATGPAADLFAAIAKGLGKVPNAYAAIGSNSPLALDAALKLDAALGKSSLSRKEIEAVKLAVSEANGCDYCVAAHSLMGRKAGLSDADLLAITTITFTNLFNRVNDTVVDFPVPAAA